MKAILFVLACIFHFMIMMICVTGDATHAKISENILSNARFFPNIIVSGNISVSDGIDSLTLHSLNPQPLLLERTWPVRFFNTLV